MSGSALFIVYDCFQARAGTRPVRYASPIVDEERNFFEENFEGPAEAQPRGYEHWAMRAAAAFTGVRHDLYEAEEILLNRLEPGWPEKLTREEAEEEFPEDPVELAEHRVWALHRGVGFARETVYVVAHLSPGHDEEGEPPPPEAFASAVVRVSAYADEGGGEWAEELVAEKEEPLSSYACANERDLRALHERIYRWLPKTGRQRERAREAAREASPVVEELMFRFSAIEELAARLDLEHEMDDVKTALESLFMDLGEMTFDEEEPDVPWGSQI